MESSKISSTNSRKELNKDEVAPTSPVNKGNAAQMDIYKALLKEVRLL